jgi:hypothetical protein
LIETPLPGNAYIVKGGLDWAWAFPFPNGDPDFDLNYQSQFGWGIPTLDQLALAPLATDFLFVGGNVPFNGTDPVSGAFFSAFDTNYYDAASAGACATPYFSLSFLQCDWDDANGQSFGPWAGLPDAQLFADQLVVRVHEVPGPLAGTGLPGLVFAIASILAWWRRRQHA